MTQKQLNFAASLYQHATNAHADCHGADTPEQQRVMQRAIARAKDGIRKLGVDPSEVVCVQDCIDVAERER